MSFPNRYFPVRAFPDRYFGPVEEPPAPERVRTIVDAVILGGDIASVTYPAPTLGIEVPPVAYAFVPVPAASVSHPSAEVEVDMPTVMAENVTTASDTSTDVQATAVTTAEVRYYPVARIDVDVRND